MYRYRLSERLRSGSTADNLRHVWPKVRRVLFWVGLYVLVTIFVGIFTAFSPSTVTGPVSSALGPIIGLIAVLVLVSIVAGVGWAIHRAFSSR